MNLIILAGNVGGDPRLNSIQTANGPMSVLNFSLAVQTSKKDPQTGKYGTQWVECSLWGSRADSLAPYIQKGSKLSVNGEPGVEVFQANDGSSRAKMTCRVNDLTMQGSAAPAQQQAPAAQQQPQYAPQAQSQIGYRNGAATPNNYNPVPQQHNPAPAQRPPVDPNIDFDSEIPF